MAVLRRKTVTKDYGARRAKNLAMSRDHRKLDVFNLADDMAVRVYAATRDFPTAEIYGLRSQIRRAAVSVPTNIVEGCARESDRDYRKFLDIAFGSSREVIYLLGLASRLDMLDKHIAAELGLFCGRVAAALAALRKANKQASLRSP